MYFYVIEYAAFEYVGQKSHRLTYNIGNMRLNEIFFEKKEKKERKVRISQSNECIQ